MPLRAELKTARLGLRPVVASDAEAVIDALRSPDVARWLTRVPSPYARAEFHKWLPNARPGAVWAITDASGLAGVIGLDPHLGYWLAPDRWGRGYATEAARAVLAAHFSDPEASDLSSGYLTGNGASARVLQKLGFVDFGQREVAQAATGRMRTHVDMVLHREAYARANPFRVDTARLILASPDPDRDLAAFISIMGQHSVARNLSTFPHPLPQDMARDRLVTAQWKGCPGFTLGIYLHNGRFIGTIGIGGDPVNVGYALHPDHWGQGIMREALAAFLSRCFDQFALDAISADHFADVPASGRVLSAVGFVPVGAGLGQSKARLEPAPDIRYRLDRNNLKA